MKHALPIVVALTMAMVGLPQAWAQEWGGVGGIAAARGYSASPAMWMPAPQAGPTVAALGPVADADASLLPEANAPAQIRRARRHRGVAVATAFAARPHRGTRHILLAAVHHDRHSPALAADPVVASAGSR